MSAQARLKQQICDAAKTHGFDACHIVSAESDAKAGKGLQDFIAAGHHGQMDWMESRMDERAAPQKLWPEAQSVIMLGVNYGPESDPLAALSRKPIKVSFRFMLSAAIIMMSLRKN